MNWIVESKHDVVLFGWIWCYLKARWQKWWRGTAARSNGARAAQGGVRQTAAPNAFVRSSARFTGRCLAPTGLMPEPRRPEGRCVRGARQFFFSASKELLRLPDEQPVGGQRVDSAPSRLPWSPSGRTDSRTAGKLLLLGRSWGLGHDQVRLEIPRHRRGGSLRFREHQFRSFGSVSAGAFASLCRARSGSASASVGPMLSRDPQDFPDRRRAWGELGDRGSCRPAR